MNSFEEIVESIKNTNYKKLVYKVNRKLSKASVRVIAVILVSIMLFTLLPSINTNAAASNSQTRFASISDFQKDRWARIQAEVFDQISLTDYDVQTPEDDGSKLIGYTVSENNGYFNWIDTGLTQWNGNSTTIAPSSAANYYYGDTYTTGYNNENIFVGGYVNYTIYNVSTPEQFRWIMEQIGNVNSDIVRQKLNVQINLTADLDMGGKQNSVWTPIQVAWSPSVYIEGNGHTIYNLKIYSKEQAVALFGQAPSKFIVKNLGFRSSMVIGDNEEEVANYLSNCKKGQAALIAAFTGDKMYFYNVHSKGGYFQVKSKNSQGIGGLIGRKQKSVSYLWYKLCDLNDTSYNNIYSSVYYDADVENYASDAGDTFFENCSTANYYMFGGSHIGGFSSYMGTSYKTAVKYDTEFPNKPEAFVYQSDGAYATFPIMLKNCYSVDCEIFSTDHDSGSFISCGDSIIAKNCFCNNTIYARDNTSGFIGRVATKRGVRLYDDAYGCSINSYFDSCWSSGIVEGKDAMAGFVGVDNGYRYQGNIETLDSAQADYLAVDASNIYKNCYTTAMVGMDYAGKYCGGFVGIDDTYSSGATVNIDGTNVTGKGTFYINCYAAGEVGNILTVTDKTLAADFETEFFDKELHLNKTDVSTILDYYPTGGFAGALHLDAYAKNSVGQYVGEKYGVFYNCFYDMQTTAMHEMAVGMANVNVSSADSESDGTTFSIPGVKGVYTENSDVKKMDGLTDFPSGPNEYAMDTDGSNSSVWNYETGYYPQLKIFMLFDLDGNGDLATLEKVLPINTSPFYIPETENDYYGSESHEVSGFDSKSEIITAYRYSQASTGTVLLNHWDYRMNTADGALSSDNDWACAVEDNKLNYNDETGYFETTYYSLAAGQYEFKIQANSTMSYNYGSDKFDGKNCVLNVPSEDCDVTIKFKYDGLRSNNYQIYAVIYNSDGVPIDENGVPTADNEEKLILLGGTEIQVVSEVWSIPGSFPFNSWNVENTDWDMKLSSEPNIYTHTHYIEPDKDSDGNYIPTTYQFKIAKDHKWDESYGVSGKSDNMGFTLTAPCSVNFKFNSKTHITTVTADNPDCITNISTEEKILFDFEGYSVIGQQALTGYDWLQSGSEVAAAEKGRMTETSEGSGIYQVTFDNVKMNQNYAYKVIKDAVDDGANSYFYINPHTEDENAVCSVTFTYNSHTGETTVSAKTKDVPDEEFAMQSLQATYYTVLGSEALTGYHWLGDQDHPKDQSEEAKEEYRLSAIENGKMDVVPGTSLYRKTIQNIPAGIYEFKVAADGSLDLSWGENDSTENYKFELKDSADVTITFNQGKGTISVSTDPAEALVTKVYVVTGTENLMGETWNTKNAVMTYNEEDGVYEYIKKGVKSGDNYAFKVIEYDNDSGDNNSFFLGGDKSEYDIKFTYNPKNNITMVYALDTEDGTDVSDSVIKEVQITSYSVLGEKGLTGYNWLGLLDNGKPGEKADELAASEAGAMTQNADGTYTKVYNDVKVGTNGETISYTFKVAANGNWDSGISYGDETGDNYYLLLNGDQSNVTTCDVTINFDPDTGKITVETYPSDCNLSEIDDSKFTWYVVGDYQLVSFDSFRAPTTVYDTVRDITSGFEFTSGKNSGERGVTWQINSERNSISEFYSRLGNGTGFSIDYTVDGKNTTGTFNTPVVELLVDVIEDEYQGLKPNDDIAHYYVGSFMPGKQWLSISALGYGYSQEYNDWKSNYLAYMDYLENLENFEESAEIYYKVLSGSSYNNAPISDQTTLIDYMKYLRDSDDAEKVSYYEDLINDYGDILAYYQIIESPVSDPGVSPIVTDQVVVGSRNLRLIPTVYLEAGNDAEVSVYENIGNEAEESAKNIVRYDENSSPDVTFTDIKDKGFSYYNFAFTAGYVITDKIGLGIYDNYINQGSTSGNYGIKKFSEELVREQDTTEKRTYGTYYAMTSAFTESSSYVDTASENMGLIADSLVKQSVIGSSYDYNSATNPDAANRQYGQTIVKIYRINDAGVNSKINMSASASENSDEYINYQKWTGQMKFTADDKGLYNVVFYWALSDGRYLSDSKLVTINVLQPGITKKVDTVYDEAGNGNTLTYTVTYTNSDFSSPVTFAILDVLPYLGDTRIGYGDENVSGTTGSDVSFNLKSLKITQSGAATIRGVYYSQDKNVRNYLSDNSGAATNAAENLNVDGEGLINPTDSSWENIIRADVGGGGTYKLSNADNVTAIAVSGVQLAVAESITVSITLEYNGKANDVYVNNTFFYARDTDQNIGMNGYSKPVTTTIVGRSLNGYVWLDKDIDGFVDEDEEHLANVTMSLYLFEEGTGNYIDTGLTTITDDDGYYSFDKLPSGTYKVVILKENNETINGKRFEDYEPTKKLLEARTETVIGSRNLASADKDDKENITSYNVSTIMPSAAEIYRGSYTNKINAVCDGFNYAKSYLNFGIIDSASKCSITLNKLGEDGNQLNGVVFKLEYFDTDTGKWISVSYDENGYIIKDSSEEGEGMSSFATGEIMPDGSKSDGTIVLPNLPEGKYRITEISTVEGYNLLASSIEVELPYKIAIGDDNNSIISTSSEPSYTENGYNYYRDITFTITNTTNLNDLLPLTGVNEFNWLIIAGIVLVLAGAGIFFFVSKKKKKSANHSA